MRRVLAVLCLAVVAGCGKDGGGSPTTPTPTPTPTPTVTRIIALEGNLDFGDVTVGRTANRELRIVNRGNGPLTISGLTGPAGFSASWTNGTIASNQWQDLTVQFAPVAQQSYSGTLTVNADQTSGTNTIAITARGVRERWSRTGVGDSVFDMPTDVTRVRIIGIYNGFSSNFIVRIGGRLTVNELIGTGWSSTRYDGTLLTSGGVVAITNSSGVSWSFEEIR